MEVRKLKELLEKYQSGQASEAEGELIEIWYASFTKNAGSDPFENNAHKRRVRNTIWNGIPLRRETVITRNFKWWHLIPAVSAAAIFLILGVAILWKQDTLPLSQTSKKEQQFPQNLFSSTTGNKERKMLILPDSTQVWLNANSSLQVLASYGDSTRMVRLSGEAFFDVAHHPDKPFSVVLEDLQINVLGTAFNVNDYAGLAAVHVSVDRGAVGVEKDGNTLQKLTPGQSLTYDKEAGTYVFQEDRTQGSWRDGKVVLTQATFAEMAQVILNMHGVVVKKREQTTQEYYYDLTLYADRPLSENMEKICSIHRLKYRRVNDELILY